MKHVKYLDYRALRDNMGTDASANPFENTASTIHHAVSSPVTRGKYYLPGPTCLIPQVVQVPAPEAGN